MKEKKNLTWKLKELPTASEVAELVDSEVISAEEAREILFGSPENDKEKIKALEEQLDFLRDLVKQLANKTTTTFVPYTRTIRYYNEPYWAKTYEVLCSSGLSVDKSTITATGGTGSLKLNGSGVGNAVYATSGTTSSTLTGMVNTGAVNKATMMTVSLNDDKLVS